jgi:peptide/nickel transport system permease protein
MAQGTLSLPSQRAKQEEETQTKQQTYGGAVLEKLFKDKITVFAMLLLLFMIGITVGAQWIGDNILGFDPTETNLRMRSKPPTWANESWPVFQEFTRSCDSDDGCNWSLWGNIFSLSATGLGDCFGVGPGECHWLGTDDAGRDALTRGVYGGRISLRIGFWVALVSMTLGVAVGLISGYYATTWIDDIINAVIMTLGSIPLLFLLIILASIFRPSPEGLAILIGIFGWMGLSRLVRGQIFSIREREYIVASRAIGTPAWKIMIRHVMPNVSSIIIVSAIFGVAGAIIAEASLSYLGVGIGPPNPSWGNMMQGSLGNFQNAPWLVVTPGIFIFLTTLGIYLFGDGLRDAMDPWIKR